MSLAAITWRLHYEAIPTAEAGKAAPSCMPHQWMMQRAGGLSALTSEQERRPGEGRPTSGGFPPRRPRPRWWASARLIASPPGNPEDRTAVASERRRLTALAALPVAPPAAVPSVGHPRPRILRSLLPHLRHIATLLGGPDSRRQG